jgi:hypothetical protein
MKESNIDSIMERSSFLKTGNTSLDLGIENASFEKKKEFI